MAYFCDVVSVFFQRSLKPKDKNRLLRARKSSIFFYLQSMEGAVVSSVLGGFSHFSELKLLGFCALLCCMLPSISPAAKYPIPTPKYHTYLRRAVPTANGACAGEMASPSYGIDSSSSSTTAKTNISSRVVVASTAAAAAAAAAAEVGCCCCCVAAAATPAASSTTGVVAAVAASQQTSACGIRSSYCKYRTRTVRAISHDEMLNHE